ncbi:MAG: T9SS type A sorting domain-containing protein [Cyclobacteriaceae bacterium]
MKKVLFLTSLFCVSILLTVSIDKNKIQYYKETRELENRRVDDAETDEPLQFFKFHQGIRTAADENFPSYEAGHKFHEFNKAYQAAVARNKNLNNARTQGANGIIEFKERGPGNVPGRTKAILVLPSDATHSTWLAGAATGGIWKTTNGGTSWVEKSGNFPVLPISSIAMSTIDNNIIYAGTGELISSIYSAIGDGIFKSIDQGETWSQLLSTASNPQFSIITRIIVDPQNPNILLASASQSSLTADNTSVIMKSIDGGISWSKVYETNRDIEQIIFTPNNFNVQYAAVNRVGILKSIDAGATWSISSQGLSTSGRIEMAVSPVDPNRLFASCVGNANTLSKTGSDLFVSTDAGVSWVLEDVTFNSTGVDFLGGQGFYDNTIACDPYNKDIVYVGGVNHFRVTLGDGSTTVDNYAIAKQNTNTFLFLTSFNNAGFYDAGRLQVGTPTNNMKIEIRFGTGLSQKAHRFFVPPAQTSGVTSTDYSYQDYSDIPFQAWDVTSSPARQLMVSFRDQNKNGFDLISPNLTATSSSTTAASALLDSREYIFIHNISYSTTANPLISVDGGQIAQLAYSFFPALAAGATWSSAWNSSGIPTTSSLAINYSAITKLNGTTITVADSYNKFDGKNQFNQTTLANVHPDHHYTVIIPVDVTAKTYQVLLATDGGVYASNVSTVPGTLEGNWQFKGLGYNTSQFYGADKKPGADEFIGGMQDNGTRKSPTSQTASAQSNYTYALGGDGFEVAWHSLDGKKIIGSLYNNRFLRSLDGGLNWSDAFSGFPLDNTGVPDPAKYPFVSKIGTSRALPDELYAVGTDGVWKSSNFGGSWTLTPITQSWGTSPTFFDVEVSRANANIIWAGSGMDNNRKLYVSTNGGKTFSATVNFPAVSLGTITKVASHPTEPKTAYSLFSFSGKPKIIRTTDLGQTWQEITGFGTGSSSTNGFPDVAVFSLYVRPDDPDIIWAGTEIGIVESLDGGATWALLNDSRFPNVSVWDMKGQDDQIVIATHGRGIWTAKAPAIQGSLLKNPVIQAVGTSPNSKFAIQFQLSEDFDSTAVFINSQKISKIPKVAQGQYILKIGNVNPGSNTTKLIGYKNTAPVQSLEFVGQQLQLSPSFQKQYFNLFTGSSDFLFSKMSPNDFGTSNLSLQTTHNYAANSESSALLLQPIIVSSTNSNFFYQDVAIVQPAATGATFGQPEFKDFVVVEGTKDGLNWIPLKDGYNAASNTNWLNAHTTIQSGTPAMSVDQNIDIKNKFNANDTLLFRFRLKADADATTGWGWSIDNLFIQQTPTGIELQPAIKEFTVYPNPTSGKIKIQYVLKEDLPTTIEVNDTNGKIIASISLGCIQAGNHEAELDLREENNGIYFIKIKTSQGNDVRKVLIRR